jgi:hypothetical protein
MVRRLLGIVVLLTFCLLRPGSALAGDTTSTKLLDPDPVVRGMAEEAILVVGKGAKAYLDEQRARARPELQEAIDRIWRRILSED